jgi:lysophospholipase L1-like esterase
MKLDAVAGINEKVIITNAGQNGNNTTELLARLDKDVLSKTPQLVVMMVGTNDMLNMRNKLSVKQYEENYQLLINKIKKHVDLIFMTIPPINTDYLLPREIGEIYGKTGLQGRVDSANAVIRKLAAKNKCHLIDLYNILQGCGGSNSDKESLFQNEANSKISDGVHPTANGYLVIGTVVYQTVNILKPKATNIVCFGDSITFGYKVQGQGTVIGQSYPAILNRILNAKK